MNKHWWCAFGAAVIALGANSVLAQPVNGCPAGQAMQSSDPSGRKVTCVPIPDTATLINMIAGEQAAREAGDAALNARIDALTESDIVGRWSVSGPTSCLQSSNGFNSNMSPLVPGVGLGSTTVSQLVANSMGTRTFVAGGTGTSSGTTQAMTFPGSFYGTASVSPTGVPTFFSGLATGNFGGASVSTFAAGFTWSIQPDGTLLIDDDNTIPQVFLAPPSFVGSTSTIENFPSYTGYISKDKRTITLVHATLSVETSVRRDAAGVVLNRSPRFCNRYRVMTRLPD